MIRRIVCGLIVVAGCVVALVLAGSGGSATGRTIKVAFDNAFGLSQGGDVRVAGVKAGSTTDFDVSKGPECQLGRPNAGSPRPCAIVTIEINRPGFQSFRNDASCSIRQQSLIGEYYVDCQPGTSNKELPKKAIIPDTQTASTVPPDLVGDIWRFPYRERLRLIIGELGTGLAGRPGDVAELLHHAAPALQQTDRVLNILANQHQIIQNFITDSNTVVTQLDQNKADVARWIQEAGHTAEISATRTTQIEQGWQRLPRFLDELRPTMQQLGALTDAQTPLLHQLQAAAPSLRTFLTELGPFSQANIPNFRTLGKASVVGMQAFRDSKKDIDTLNALAKDAPPTAKPLRQWLQALDTRNRSPVPDVRAQESAPPAPDPAVFHAGQGFTGMESILNYFYFQTLAINQFDQVSHLLSTENNLDPLCTPFETVASITGSANANAVRARCNAYTGPYQPGITASDPTNQGGGPPLSTNSPSPQSSESTPVRGSLAATRPLPGQVDYSLPHPTLPPSAQELAAQLQARVGSQIPLASGPGAVSAPQPVDPATMSRALQYLLAP